MFPAPKSCPLLSDSAFMYSKYLFTDQNRGSKSSIPCDYRMSPYLSIAVLQPHFVVEADKVEVIWYIMLLRLGSQHLSSLAAA